LIIQGGIIDDINMKKEEEEDLFQKVNVQQNWQRYFILHHHPSLQHSQHRQIHNVQALREAA